MWPSGLVGTEEGLWFYGALCGVEPQLVGPDGPVDAELMHITGQVGFGYVLLQPTEPLLPRSTYELVWSGVEDLFSPPVGDLFSYTEVRTGGGPVAHAQVWPETEARVYLTSYQVEQMGFDGCSGLESLGQHRFHIQIEPAPSQVARYRVTFSWEGEDDQVFDFVVKPGSEVLLRGSPRRSGVSRITVEGWDPAQRRVLLFDAAEPTACLLVEGEEDVEGRMGLLPQEQVACADGAPLFEEAEPGLKDEKGEPGDEASCQAVLGGRAGAWWVVWVLLGLIAAGRGRAGAGRWPG